jgi:hypothetical protein
MAMDNLSNLTTEQVGVSRPSGNLISDLKSGILQLVVTIKNLTLYPATNKTNVEAVDSLHHWLSGFFKQNGPLTLEITKDSLIYESEETVYQERPNEPILTTPLFRDGVQTLTFDEGLTKGELLTFLNILVKFRNIADSENEDIVASLWEATFNDIRYSIANEYEQVSPEFEISAMKVAKPGIERDVDAPMGSDALEPMKSDGLAPIAKPISSLFALVESPSLMNSLKPPQSGGLDQFGQERMVESAQGGFESNFSDNISGEPGSDLGFEPFSSDSYSGSPAGDGFEPFGGGAGGGAEIEGQEAYPSGANSYPEAGGEEVDGVGGTAPASDDAELDIDMGSVAEAFKAMESADSLASDRKTSDKELTLESIKDRPEPEGPELAERLKYWGLNPQEIKQIAAMLKWDENRNYSYDSLEIISLLIDSDVFRPVYLQQIIPFLTNEIKNSLKKADFKYFNHFFIKIREKAQAGWTTEQTIYKELLSKISSPEILAFLIDPGPPEEELEKGFEDLRYFTYQLPPEGVEALVSLLSKTVSPKLWRLIIERLAFALVDNCQRNAHLINSLNDRALTQTVDKLQGHIKELPQQFVSNLLRHKSPNVRQAVARAILENDPDNVPTLCAHLALDSDPAIQKLVRPALSKKRNPLLENILTSYLQQNFEANRFSEDNRLLDLYRLLGHCGSAQSVPFLHDTLMKVGFKGMWKKNVLEIHKVGAALALNLMTHSPDIRDLLQKAQKSSFKSVRLACQEAERLVND